MLTNFLFGDWQGTITFVLCGLAALAAVIYVPSPLKTYAVNLLILFAVVAKVYSLGYSTAQAKAKLQFDAAISKINAETEKAVAAAALKTKSEDEANIKTVKDALDQQTMEATRREAEYEQMLDAISKAGTSADGAVPGLILDAIRGRK